MSSIVFNEPLEQFVVEIPGKGYAYVDQFRQVQLTQDADLACADAMEYIRDIPKAVYNAYHRLGLEVVGNTARVLRRTITLTPSDWEYQPDL